jgi:hypothetical protein
MHRCRWNVNIGRISPISPAFDTVDIVFTNNRIEILINSYANMFAP